MRLPYGYELVRSPIEFGITKVMGPDGLVATIDDADLHSHPDIESDVQRLCLDHHREMDRAQQVAVDMSDLRASQDVRPSNMARQMDHSMDALRCSLGLQRPSPNRTATHMEILRREQDRMMHEHAKRAYAALAEPGIPEKLAAPDPSGPDLDAMRPVEYLRLRHSRWVKDVEGL